MPTDWQAVSAIISVIVAVACFCAWIFNHRDRALNEKLDIHFKFIQEKFGEIGETMQRSSDKQEDHSRQLADYGTRIAVLEVKAERD